MATDYDTLRDFFHHETRSGGLGPAPFWSPKRRVFRRGVERGPGRVAEPRRSDRRRAASSSSYGAVRTKSPVATRGGSCR